MKPQRIIWTVLCFMCWLAACSATVQAQAGDDIELRIQLRANDGAAVTGEPVVLQRLPDEEEIAPVCRTDAIGSCAWRVQPGLYQLLFDRPLDELSSLALAEGGLSGFGITVGDAPITYHFTIHSDGRVYFDDAPGAAVPAPIIPAWTDIHQEGAVTPEPVSVALRPLESPATPDADSPAADQPPFPAGRLLLFLALGLAAGGGLHLYSRRRASLSQPARPLAEPPVGPAAEQPSVEEQAGNNNVRVIDQEPPDA